MQNHAPNLALKFHFSLDAAREIEYALQSFKVIDGDDQVRHVASGFN
jgi:hypothetical protein